MPDVHTVVPPAAPAPRQSVAAPAPPEDPNKALVDSVRAVVRAELANPTTAQTEPKPGLWQVIALALLALDVTLLFLLVDSQLQLSRDSVIVAIRRLTPFIGGAAFLAFLNDIRKQLLKWCRPVWMRAVVATLAVALLLATFVPFEIYVRALPGTIVTVDSAQQMLEPTSELQRLRVRGLGIHQLKVSEPGALDDSAARFTIGAVDVMRALRAPSGGPDSARLQVVIPAHVSTYHDSASRYLVVTGRFDELFLREARKVAYVADSGPLRAAVWYRLRRGRGKTTAEFAVPKGRAFDFSLHPLLCDGARFDSTTIHGQENLEFNVKCPSPTRPLISATDSVSDATPTRRKNPSPHPGVRRP